MSRITIDATLSAQLRSATGPVELCDGTGEVLGQYVPRAGGAAPRPQISDEELARRKQHRGGRSLVEILADLEKRA